MRYLANDCEWHNVLIIGNIVHVMSYLVTKSGTSPLVPRREFNICSKTFRAKKGKMVVFGPYGEIVHHIVFNEVSTTTLDKYRGKTMFS